MKNNDFEVLVEIKNKEELYEKYNSSILNKDLSDYIYRQCHGESFNKKIKLNFQVSFKLSKEEKEKISNMIKKYFTIHLREEKIQNQLNNRMYLFLSLIGIILIVLSQYFSNILVLSEILSIFGWVAFWEIAYRFVFEDIKKRLLMRRTKQLSTAMISFL